MEGAFRIGRTWTCPQKHTHPPRQSGARRENRTPRPRCPRSASDAIHAPSPRRGDDPHVGLHLKFTLSARGSDPLTTHLRSDPTVMRDLLRWLTEQHLVEDHGVCWLSLVTSDSQVYRREGYTTMDELLDHLDEACSDFPIRILNVGGLRTSPTFPNPFHEFTTGETALSGWLSLRIVSGTTATARGFEAEFTEVDFIHDSPTPPLIDLDQQLQAILGVKPLAGCFSIEPEDDSF